MKVGDGMEAGVDMGPVISAAHRDRVLGYVERGASEGAKLALDGRARTLPREGYFVGPVSYTHLRAHETVLDIVCRLLLAQKNTT